MRQDSAFSISNCNAPGCSNPYSHLSVSSIRPPSILLRYRNTPSSTPQRSFPSVHCPNSSPYATCFEPWNVGQAIGFFRPYKGFQSQPPHQPRCFFAVPIQCCGNAPLSVASFMSSVGFDEEGFVGCVGVGAVLMVVVKAAFGQVCDVQQVFERVLRPQCLDGLALSFSVCFWLRAFNSFR